MSKKTIVLADNSYTIRRIVELSFSEEEDIELISFEDGANLKEKLLELKPEIVLVDIKLPEFSGYEVCKFINTTDSLKTTKVFLLKGGFEPIDESLLTNLVYASIITKPFDSNALVATIKKILSAPQTRTPSSAPEETPARMPDIGGFPQPGSEIDITDMKEEKGANGILGDNGVHGSPQYFHSDDVLPSEEITQGTQPEIDTLAPNKEDDMANPFADDASADRATQKTLSEEELDIKMNIRQQEQELDITSVTQEEIQIKKQMGDFKTPAPVEQAGAAGEAATAPGIGNLELDMPAAGPLGDAAEMGKEPAAGVPGNQPGVPDTPAMEKYPEIEQAFGGDDINFEAEMSSEPNVMDSAPSPGAKPGFADFEPQKEAQEPAAFDQFQAPETPVQAEAGDMGKPQGGEPGAGMEFEIPGMGGPAAAENQPVEDVPAAPESAPADVSGQFQDEPGTPPVEKASPPQEGADELPGIKKEELMYKVEDKLTLAIKEILWDVVPPMAEKIIKGEIEKLKEEVDKSFEYLKQ